MVGLSSTEPAARAGASLGRAGPGVTVACAGVRTFPVVPGRAAAHMSGIQLLPLFTASLILAAAPGPDTVLTVRSSAHGLGSGLRYVAGVAVGIVFWSLAAMLLLQAVVVQFPWAITAIELAGGLFLGWLGTLIIRHGRRVRGDSAEAVPAPRRPTLTGLTSSLTNPKTGVIFAAVFPQVLPDTVTPTALLIVPALTALTVAAWLAGLSLLVRAAGARAHRFLAGAAFETTAGALILLIGAGIVLRTAI